MDHCTPTAASIFRLATGSWDQLGADASAVRTAVFVHEQGIDASEEWDALDHTAVHAVAWRGWTDNAIDASGSVEAPGATRATASISAAESPTVATAIATGRLLVHAPGVGRIGRMAVLRAERRSGAGRAILDALLAAAQARGDRQVVLNAQRSAEGFYAGAGFRVLGAPFDEVGIPHIQMARDFVAA